MMQRQIQGRDPGGLPFPLPNLFLDQTEARGAEKNFFETGPPHLSQGLDENWMVVGRGYFSHKGSHSENVASAPRVLWSKGPVKNYSGSMWM